MTTILAQSPRNTAEDTLVPTSPLDRRALLGLLGATLLSGPASARQQAAVGPDVLWGSIELADADDRLVRVDQIDSRLTLLVLWAHWCPLCLFELGTLSHPPPAFADSGIEIVLVSHPSDWTANLRVASDRGIALRHARPSPRNAASVLQRALVAPDGIFYVPRNILYDRARQEVVWTHLGVIDWTAPQGIASIARSAAGA